MTKGEANVPMVIRIINQTHCVKRIENCKLNFAPLAPDIKNRLHKLAGSLKLLCEGNVRLQTPTTS